MSRYSRVLSMFFPSKGSTRCRSAPPEQQACVFGICFHSDLANRCGQKNHFFLFFPPAENQTLRDLEQSPKRLKSGFKKSGFKIWSVRKAEQILNPTVFGTRFMHTHRRLHSRGCRCGVVSFLTPGTSCSGDTIFVRIKTTSKTSVTSSSSTRTIIDMILPQAQETIHPTWNNDSGVAHACIPHASPNSAQS